VCIRVTWVSQRFRITFPIGRKSFYVSYTLFLRKGYDTVSKNRDQRGNDFVCVFVCQETWLVFSHDMAFMFWLNSGPCNQAVAVYWSFFSMGATAPSGPGPPHYRGFTITLRHVTLGRTPLGEWSARRSDLYLSTHNTHKRHTSRTPAGFEPTIPVSERPQTHALGRAATGIGIYWSIVQNLSRRICHFRYVAVIKRLDKTEGYQDDN
jgi:hypothetical protein